MAGSAAADARGCDVEEEEAQRLVCGQGGTRTAGGLEAGRRGRGKEGRVPLETLIGSLPRSLPRARPPRWRLCRALEEGAADGWGARRDGHRWRPPLRREGSFFLEERGLLPGAGEQDAGARWNRWQPGVTSPRGPAGRGLTRVSEGRTGGPRVWSPQALDLDLCHELGHELGHEPAAHACQQARGGAVCMSAGTVWGKAPPPVQAGALEVGPAACENWEGDRRQEHGGGSGLGQKGCRARSSRLAEETAWRRVPLEIKWRLLLLHRLRRRRHRHRGRRGCVVVRR